MIFTSASVSKQIRALEEEKEHLLGQEQESCRYVLSVGEEADPPEYDYEATRRAVDKIDEQVCAIRHALHVFNMQTVLPLDGMTIDEALIKLAQLSRKKSLLSDLRSARPKRRVSGGYLRSNAVTEYEYANYDIAKAEADYQEVAERIRELQMAIDYANQTISFEVEL